MVCAAALRAAPASPSQQPRKLGSGSASTEAGSPELSFVLEPPFEALERAMVPPVVKSKKKRKTEKKSQQSDGAADGDEKEAKEDEAEVDTPDLAAPPSTSTPLHGVLHYLATGGRARPYVNPELADLVQVSPLTATNATCRVGRRLTKSTDQRRRVSELQFQPLGGFGGARQGRVRAGAAVSDL